MQQGRQISFDRELVALDPSILNPELSPMTPHIRLAPSQHRPAVSSQATRCTGARLGILHATGSQTELTDGRGCAYTRVQRHRISSTLATGAALKRLLVVPALLGVLVVLALPTLGQAFDPCMAMATSSSGTLIQNWTAAACHEDEPQYNACISVSDLLPEVAEMVNWLRQYGYTKPGYAGGGNYTNSTWKLPRADHDGLPITYKEYDVDPLDENPRTDRRIVVGTESSGVKQYYYTSDHYTSFKRVC